MQLQVEPDEKMSIVIVGNTWAWCWIEYNINTLVQQTIAPAPFFPSPGILAAARCARCLASLYG